MVFFWQHRILVYLYIALHSEWVGQGILYIESVYTFRSMNNCNKSLRY